MAYTRRKTLAIVGTVTAATAIFGGIRLSGSALASDESPQPTPPVTTPSETTSPTTPPTSPDPSTPPVTEPPCTTTAGDPAEVVAPGIGAVTVTISVCGGKISSVSSALSLSNYGRNRKALLEMDRLAVEYAVTDINMITYSGATLTSEAYRASLQSALTRAEI